MHKYIVMGPQGCGKGTQAKMLEKDFDLVHISVGDIFRWQVQHHTKLGAKVKRIVASGLLVPDELVNEVVTERLELHDWNYGFILDGFPRNRPCSSSNGTTWTPSSPSRCRTRWCWSAS